MSSWNGALPHAIGTFNQTSGRERCAFLDSTIAERRLVGVLGDTHGDRVFPKHHFFGAHVYLSRPKRCSRTFCDLVAMCARFGIQTEKARKTIFESATMLQTPSPALPTSFRSNFDNASFRETRGGFVVSISMSAALFEENF